MPESLILARERLFAVLDNAVLDDAVSDDPGRRTPAPVALLHAPSGAGKTTLLTTWAARGPRTAVVTLDRRDDPAARRAAVRAALTCLDGHRPCLVVDNAHELAERPAARLLVALARRRPLRLVLSGRTPPPLRLWLRARGRLREIRAEDLAFTPEEAVALLHVHRVALDPRDLADLMRRTGGHAGALRLAVTSLTTRGTPVPTARQPV